RYRKTYDEYVAFMKLTSETKQRDASLQSQQAQAEAQLNLTPTKAASPAISDAQSAAQPANIPVPPPAGGSAIVPQPATSAPGHPNQAANSKFDGAGIVTKLAKSFPGGPQFVLLAPDGKMLSILQPGPGVDLNRYAGRPMGIFGQRVHRDDWNV